MLDFMQKIKKYKLAKTFRYYVKYQNKK